MGAGFRVNECGVASSVRSLDLDVGFDDLKARGRGRLYRRGEARAHHEGRKVTPGDVSTIRVVSRLVFRVVCHGFSCNEFIAFSYSTASSRRQGVAAQPRADLRPLRTPVLANCPGISRPCAIWMHLPVPGTEKIKKMIGLRAVTGQ